MSSHMSWSWRILGGGAAAVVLLGGGMGVGVALTGGAAAATANTRAAHPTGSAACAKAVAKAKATGTAAAKRQALAHCRRVPAAQRLLGHTLHAQLTVKTKTGYSTIAFERGTIESVNGGVLTVKAADGTTWTWHLLKGSVLRQNGGALAASQLAAGERILAVGPVSNGANYVKMAQVRPAS
jgi:hypothetical protein